MSENTERKSKIRQAIPKSGAGIAGMVKTLVLMDKAVSLLPERAADIQLFEFYTAVMLRHYLQMLEHKVTEEEKEKYTASFKADMRQMTDIYLKAMDGRPVLSEKIADLPTFQAGNSLLISAYLRIIEQNIEDKMLELGRQETLNEEDQDITAHVVAAAAMSAAEADKEKRKAEKAKAQADKQVRKLIQKNRKLRRKIRRLEEAAGRPEPRNLPESSPKD